jgi:class 3 adenylate cyclase
MSAEVSQELSIDGATALLSHLRKNPAHLRSAPEDLARQFGLSTAFVQNVITEAQRPRTEVAPVLTKRLSFDFLGKIWNFLRDQIKRTFSKPMPFFGWSTAFLVGFSVFVHFAVSKAPVTPGSPGWDTVANSGSVLLWLLAQGACYFSNGKVRYPLQGGLILWVLLTGVTSGSIALQAQGRGEAGLAEAVWISTLAMFFLSAFYVLVFSMVALLGGWFKARNSELRDDEMTRQELLERYFELQQRLEKGNTRARVVSWLEASPTALLFRKYPLPVTVAFFATTSLTADFISSLGNNPTTGPLTLSMFVAIVIQIALFFVRFGAVILIGLLSPSIGSAILLGLASGLTMYVVKWLPWFDHGPRYATSIPTMAFYGFLCLVMGIISGFAGIGADLQKRVVREQSLADNDPATVLAEMLRIQWKLSDETKDICVLVVDAAKSSQMKAEADPLAVEYSFREYQLWLEEISEQFQGKVHSTAGDGAVVAFPDCHLGLAAARRIQTDLDNFNREVNRLPSPFRLRIGLHIGQVVGDLDDVEFTEVIDIAAHVQGAATIGGIAVTGAVVKDLPVEEFLPLAKEIDGQTVSLVLNPRED